MILWAVIAAAVLVCLWPLIITAIDDAEIQRYARREAAKYQRLKDLED